MIVSAYYRTGKSFFQHFSHLKVVELERQPEEDYISKIEKVISKDEHDILIVNTDRDVREWLESQKIPFLLVTPKPTLKELYRQKFEEAEYSEQKIEAILQSWESDHKSFSLQGGCYHYRLNETETLSDAV